MIPITRDLRIALYHFNRGVERAKNAYYDTPPPCSTCTSKATCARCRKRARADLLVATSQAECAELLEIIDRPSPYAAACGTIGGHQAHYRRGEKPCEPCKQAAADYARQWRRTRGAS